MKDILEEVAYTWAPDLILAPSCNDAHQDHRTIGEVLPTVFRNQLSLSYEIPKWDGDLGRPSIYFPLTADVAHRKVELLHKCFPSQAGRDWWDDEVFLGLARLRGMECRAPYSEGVHLHEVGDRTAAAAAEQGCTGGHGCGRRRREGAWSMTVFVDPDLPAPLLRQSIYDGHVVVLTTLPSVRQFVDYTWEQLADLFKSVRSERAHEHIDMAKMAKLLGSWKPRFIHSARSKDLVCKDHT